MTQDLLTPTADDRRDAYIAHYGLLDSPPGRDLQALVELLAHVCEVPKAAVNIITSTTQHQVVATGFDPTICTREDSMCGIVMNDARPVVVADASLDPRFADNPFVNGEIGNVRFYASAALTTSDGTPIGRLCVFDRAPHELTAMQRQALETLAAQVMDLFDLRVRSLELERSLQDLIEARDELSRSNEQLAHFAGQVSHDLRAPLTAILANAEMLMLEDPVATDPDVASMVDAVSASGQRMAAMIDSMLSNAQEGGQLREHTTHLNDVFDHALADLDTVVTSSAAQVVVDDLPTVTGDAQMLYSVALNLLTNALKFTRPDQPARVHVSSQQVDGAFRIRVQDNGIGIPSDQRESVFALFARADASAAGNGVGLTTVRQTVEAHGGRVGIEAAEGGGTTVWFDLPHQ
jgi:signal transduction histidine kinase